MRVLVAYASKYGSTQGIAERIATTLRAEGLAVDLEPVTGVDDVSEYDAFVIGSAAYVGSWLKEATRFVRENRDVLDARPVWTFSSGPVGTQSVTADGRDAITASAPKEFAEFKKAIRPKDQKVFWGALEGDKLRGFHRLFKLTPPGQKLLVEGDFREWNVIEEWARGIARELAGIRVAVA